MWETWLRSLAWKGPLEEVMSTHSSILAWTVIPMDKGARRPAVHGIAKSRTGLSDLVLILIKHCHCFHKVIFFLTLLTYTVCKLFN